MPEPEGESEVVALVTRTIEEHAQGNPSALATAIVLELRRAGYEIRKPEMIPIRPHPTP
jgi:hypothetical protein